MKKLIALMLALLMLLSVAACSTLASTAAATPAERAEKWLVTQIENNSLFSFDYAGTPLTDWEKTVEREGDAWSVSYRSPESLVFSFVATLDREAARLEYVGAFKNEADTASPVISDIQAIDSVYEIAGADLVTAQGCTKSEYDFEPIFVDLTETPTWQMRTTGGRSSDGAFPYFDISNGTEGLIGAIGWTGNWQATFSATEKGVRMQAGLQQTRIALPAKDEIRTPSMVLLFFDGDRDEGHNRLRSMLLNDYMPKDENGQAFSSLPLTLNTSGGSGEDYVLDTMTLADRLEHEWDMLWVDAGWHGDVANADITANVWSTQVGNWYVNTDIWTRDFRKVNAALDAADRDLLLWFEPERSVHNSKLATEHPDYFLVPSATNVSGTLVYDFTSPDAVAYMTDLIADQLETLSVDWYRQDCNFAPAETWLHNDNLAGENMVGYTEIKYITGLYTFLDGLVERIPGLMIDNCAAGGRRLDIEMMSRSVPLWRTDYTSNTAATIADGVRNINYGLSWWVPLHCGGRADDGMNNSYQWRSMISAGVTAGPLGTGTNDNWFKRMLDEYIEIRDLFSKDYYILSAGFDDTYKSENAVYEYYDPAAGKGMLLAFCPQESDTLIATYALKGLDAAAEYELYAVDTGDTGTFTGAQLMEQGLELRFAQSYESLLIHITKK